MKNAFSILLLLGPSSRHFSGDILLFHQWLPNAASVVSFCEVLSLFYFEWRSLKHFAASVIFIRCALLFQFYSLQSSSSLSLCLHDWFIPDHRPPVAHVLIWIGLRQLKVHFWSLPSARGWTLTQFNALMQHSSIFANKIELLQTQAPWRDKISRCHFCLNQSRVNRVLVSASMNNCSYFLVQRFIPAASPSLFIILISFISHLGEDNEWITHAKHRSERIQLSAPDRVPCQATQHVHVCHWSKDRGLSHQGNDISRLVRAPPHN